MTCDELDARLAASGLFLDPGEEDADLAAHLAGCRACRARADALEAATRRIPAIVGRAPPLSTALRERVLAATATPSPRPRWGVGLLVVALVAAAGVVTVVARPEPPTPSAPSEPRGSLPRADAEVAPGLAPVTSSATPDEAAVLLAQLEADTGIRPEEKSRLVSRLGAASVTSTERLALLREIRLRLDQTGCVLPNNGEIPTGK
jgi:hypothetical protein